jgi:hypothetical protein
MSLFRKLRHLRNALLSRDPQTKYLASYFVVEAFAKKFDVRIHNPYLTWYDDAQVLKDFQGIAPHADDVPPSKFTLYSMIRSVNNLPGDTAECGVFTGESSYLICHANRSRKHYTHHCFDSFEGLSEPDRKDEPEDPQAISWRKGDLPETLTLVREHLKEFDFVRYYKGWIPDRFDEVADRKFSFVHVDVDLFQPTRDSLEFFYERMVPGGILLCDDYGFTTCPGATKAFDDFIVDKAEQKVIHLPTGQGFIVKRSNG